MGTTLAGSVQVAAWAGLALLGSLAAHPVAFVCLYGLAFAAWAWAVRDVLRRPGQQALGVVLGVALLVRLAALPMEPSDDLSRYLWEGRVANAGFDPYRLPPDAPELARLAADDPWHGRINHPGWTAIYPPLATLTHRALAALRYEPLTMKVAFLLVEAVLVALIMALLRARGLDPRRVLIYAWNPLAVLAVAGEGHHDVLAAAMLVGGLLLLQRGRQGSSVAAFVAAVLSKTLALAALPALVRGVRLRAWLWAVPVLVASLLPFRESGSGLWASLVRFTDQLHFNDSLHELASMAAGPQAARWAMAIVWLVVAGRVVAKAYEPAHGAAVLVATLLLVIPTVHPWYLLLLLPLLCLFPWWGWLALTATVLVAYLPQADARDGRPWTEWHEAKLLEYAPLFGWMAWSATRRLVGRAEQPT